MGYFIATLLFHRFAEFCIYLRRGKEKRKFKFSIYIPSVFQNIINYGSLTIWLAPYFVLLVFSGMIGVVTESLFTDAFIKTAEGLKSYETLDQQLMLYSTLFNFFVLPFYLNHKFLGVKGKKITSIADIDRPVKSNDSKVSKLYKSPNADKSIYEVICEKEAMLLLDVVNGVTGSQTSLDSIRKLKAEHEVN